MIEMQMTITVYTEDLQDLDLKIVTVSINITKPCMFPRKGQHYMLVSKWFFNFWQIANIKNYVFNNRL
jgi:hypothetical protein